MVICLEHDANDLLMAQLMPLSPYHLLLHKNTNWFNLSGAGLPMQVVLEKRPLNGCLHLSYCIYCIVCACYMCMIYVWVCFLHLRFLLNTRLVAFSALTLLGWAAGKASGL